MTWAIMTWAFRGSLSARLLGGQKFSLLWRPFPTSGPELKLRLDLGSGVFAFPIFSSIYLFTKVPFLIDLYGSLIAFYFVVENCSAFISFVIYAVLLLFLFIYFGVHCAYFCFSTSIPLMCPTFCHFDF